MKAQSCWTTSVCGCAELALTPAASACSHLLFPSRASQRSNNTWHHNQQPKQPKQPKQSPVQPPHGPAPRTLQKANSNGELSASLRQASGTAAAQQQMGSLALRWLRVPAHGLPSMHPCNRHSPAVCAVHTSPPAQQSPQHQHSRTATHPSRGARSSSTLCRLLARVCGLRRSPRQRSCCRGWGGGWVGGVWGRRRDLVRTGCILACCHILTCAYAAATVL